MSVLLSMLFKYAKSLWLRNIHLVELVQAGIVFPVKPNQTLHRDRDLHEGGEVPDVEVLNAANLSLGENFLSSIYLSFQFLHGLLVLPCLKYPHVTYSAD